MRFSKTWQKLAKRPATSHVGRQTGRWALGSLAVFGLLCLAGCSAARPLTVPLDTLRYAHSSAQRACCLVVFLPGRYDSAVQYEKAHFIDAVRQSGVAVNMMAVEAHYGYYTSRTIVARLRADVIAPALAQGYERIWLVGVSMGGLGALLYIRDYPRDITGVVALAPLLGEADIVQEITQAGGLWQWDIPTVPRGAFPHELWQWLKGYLQHHGEKPRLYLGHGRQDRFAPANALLATYLPPTQVQAIAGGHAWSTGRTLWQTLLTTAASPSSREFFLGIFDPPPGHTDGGEHKRS